jgi:phage regulator Rha-like protein
MPVKRPNNNSEILVPIEIIQNKIYLIRGHKVMFDRDLAELYGVETKQLTRQLRRNIDRFPDDFMFQLNRQEAEVSRCQFGTLKQGQNIKYLPYVFTEQGVAMLSSVLKSKRAVQVNIQIMRVFTKLRELMISHKDLARKIEDLERKFQDHDKRILQIFEAIRHMMAAPKQKEDEGPDPYKRHKVGYIAVKEDAK